MRIRIIHRKTDIGPLRGTYNTFSTIAGNKVRNKLCRTVLSSMHNIYPPKSQGTQLIDSGRAGACNKQGKCG